MVIDDQNPPSRRLETTIWTGLTLLGAFWIRIFWILSDSTTSTLRANPFAPLVFDHLWAFFTDYRVVLLSDRMVGKS